MSQINLCKHYFLNSNLICNFYLRYEKNNFIVFYYYTMFLKIKRFLQVYEKFKAGDLPSRLPEAQVQDLYGYFESI